MAKVVQIQMAKSGCSFGQNPGLLEHVGMHTPARDTRECQEIALGADKLIEGRGEVREDVRSDPKHVIAYDDGEVRRQFALSFRARPIGDSLRDSDESSKVSLAVSQ
jgi:hypothetical protein